MKQNIFLSILLQIAFIAIIGFECNIPNSTPKGNSVVYRSFDLFYLKGFDTLKDANKRGSVEVHYKANLPVFIKYYKAARTVTLIFEDSFSVNSNRVYVYSTSNFKGGQPGKHMVYAGHYEEYRHLIYVGFNDTLICQTEDAQATRNFDFDMYIRGNFARVSETSSGEIDYDNENAKLSIGKLYSKWFALLLEKHKTHPQNRIIIQSLPPD